MTEISELMFFVGSKVNKIQQFPNSVYSASDVLKMVKSIEDKICELAKKQKVMKHD